MSKGFIIRVAPGAGFCYGVKRAVDAAFAAAGANESVVTFGALIHNPQVVKRLEEKKIGVINSPEEFVSGTVIIRTHGLPPATIEELKARGAELLDLTCPTVKAVQQKAAALAADGYVVVIIGDATHPEVQAIAGYAGGATVIVNSEEEAKALPNTTKIGVVMQTTHAASACWPIIGALLGKAQEVRVFNTLCDATSRRQEAALTVAREADVVVVVGGRNSANTRRLVTLCQSAGATVYHVETAEELVAEWFRDVRSVGVTAGTSTPGWIIEGVIDRLRRWGGVVDPGLSVNGACGR